MLIHNHVCIIKLKKFNSAVTAKMKTLYSRAEAFVEFKELD